ncbi:MAG: hypothetical protein IKM02_05625, partial [Clostridia bacterium]|nr:hypothetical protein [Clostridia bacterium]
MKRFIIRAALIGMILAGLLMGGQTAFALDMPEIYVEVIDGIAGYEPEKETCQITVNGEIRNQDINILPTDEARMIVWEPVSGALGYAVSIRDVDADEAVCEKMPQTDCRFDTMAPDPEIPDKQILQTGVNYEITVGAYAESPDACDWSAPYYFRVEKIVLKGRFYDDSIEINPEEVVRIDGEVYADGVNIDSVSYQIDGWLAEDADGSYCAQKVSGKARVSLMELEELALDTNIAPLNVPGEYTLRLAASAEDGTWAEIDAMKVIVAEPAPVEIELEGFFSDSSVTILPGERVQVDGEVYAEGGDLQRVTYQIDGWNGTDGNSRYRTQAIGGTDHVYLADLGSLVLDTNAAPLNVPGEYTLKLAAHAEDGTWAELDSMQIVVQGQVSTPEPAAETPEP